MNEKQRRASLKRTQEAFAYNLRRLRTEKGWKQWELAEKVGMHRVTVTRLETALHQPLLAEACLIAEVFGVSIETMLLRPPED